jgi:hypothetical protein
MLTSSESSGNEVIALLADTPPVGTDRGLTPKGPTGLLRALQAASGSAGAQRALPTVDATTVGAGASLFDYDAALALDLDGDTLEQ